MSKWSYEPLTQREFTIADCVAEHLVCGLLRSPFARITAVTGAPSLTRRLPERVSDRMSGSGRLLHFLESCFGSLAAVSGGDFGGMPCAVQTQMHVGW